MKKTTKRFISIVLSLSMIMSSLIIVPLATSAASATQELENEILTIWADPENTLTQADLDDYNSKASYTTMNGAVAIHRRSSGSSNGYYLFLPSNAKCTNLRFWYKGTSLTINGQEVENGGTTDALASIDAGGVSQSFTFKLGSTSNSVTVMKSGECGAVYIDLDSGSISKVNASKSNYEGGTIMVVQPDGTVDYDGPLEKMQGRGNATWKNDGTKNPFNLKLGASASLLGMNKAKKWILLANIYDPYLIKDQATYDFSKYIGVKYQPTCKPVDVYCNQIYMGSYQLSEKVELKSSRIDVNDAYENLEIANGTVDTETGIITPADLESMGLTVAAYKADGSSAGTSSSTIANTVGARRYTKGINNPSDITGGYLYEIEISERLKDENTSFTGYNRQGWVIKSCDYVTKEMSDYSFDLLYALGGAIYNTTAGQVGDVPSVAVKTTSGAVSSYSNIGGTTITNPAPAQKYQGMHWSDLLDADSAVKFFWTQEFFKNLDASTSSTYLYKDSDRIDGKLYSGPVWDMDHSMEARSADNAGTISTRWGQNWTVYNGWYARNVRFYKWDAGKTLELANATSDSQSPLTFYAALYQNQPDFQQMYREFWYDTMIPALNILMGNDTDPTGQLKSINQYLEDVSKSAYMDNIRHGRSTSDKSYFTLATMKTELNEWISKRVNWINSQTEMARIDMSKVSVQSVPNQVCTGSAIEPEIVLSYNGKNLVKGKDYDIEYSANISATSLASAKITGKGYYTGTKNVAFTIVAGEIAETKIYESAYIGDTLTATTTTKTGDETSNFVSYQWNANGSAISGATDSTYEIKPEDAGKIITVTATGDGQNIKGTATSNDCEIATTERPAGFQKLIAAWDYDFTTNSDALTTSDETGAEYYYNATSGERIDGSELRASVNATATNKIKWSGTADLYVNDSNTVASDQAPVMGTSKSDSLAWGRWPYFETTVSTLGYQSLTFSAKLGGTKKAPRSWKLQYSLDGVNFTDIDESSYTITANKTMEQAFDNIALPAECNNKQKVYIRATVSEDMAINGINTIAGAASGDAAINNIKIKGESIAVITELAAPTVKTTSLTNDQTVFDTESITVLDNNGGAKVYYKVNDGEVTEFTQKFNPFDSTTAKAGDTVTITAWSEAGAVRSEDTVATITFGGVSISEFEYMSYSKNVFNGKVYSTGGAYGESASMSTYADGASQYVPLWNDDNGAFSIAPDDGALWSADSGYYFEVPTAGYEDIRFTAQMYTTNQGPNSVSLQYSTDNKTWNDLDNTVVLPANAELETVFMTSELPEDCDNKQKVYIRVATTEDQTHLGDKLHKNQSKGNLYINNVVISGEDNGDYKMPYTNKNTDYFGSSPIKYHSPSGMAMQYMIVNPDGDVIESGTYQNEDIKDENGTVISEAGIKIADNENFLNKDTGAYTVLIWAGDDDDRSLVNSHKYYFKGGSVVKFSYTETKRPIADYSNEDMTVLYSTSGANNSGQLSMYPNSVTPAAFTYTDVYGAKVAWSAENPFTATKNLNKQSGNGYWLIKASTKGFKGLTLTAEQISSNKGPRDWGIAYSTDGVKYTYVKDSNARAISNDASPVPVETYNNFALPAELDDKDTVYIKIFINGGESVDGAELETLLKGNTGMNNVEISGISLPGEIEYVIRTVAYEDEDMNVVGKTLVPAYINVNGIEYYAPSGEVSVTVTEGEKMTATASSNNKYTFPTTVSMTARENGSKTIPIMALDTVADGIVNAKDYAMISQDSKYANHKDYMRSIFNPFITLAE